VSAELRPVSASRAEQLRADVEHLAGIDRRTTTSGERRAAESVATRLRQIGAADVRVEEFRAQSTWAWSTALHVGVGAAAAIAGGAFGRAAAGLALVSYDADTTGRAQPLRRLLPSKPGASTVGRLPSRGARRRTLLLIAHHDAAPMGWVWSEPMTRANRRRMAKTGQAAPSHLLPTLAFAAIASGWAPLRVLGGAILGATLLFAAQSGASPTSPGANDNATGVAVALEVVRRLAAQRPDGLEVIALFPGGEEIGATGTYEWLRAHRAELDRETTLAVGLDSMGSSGEMASSRRDGFVGAFGEEDLALLDRAARNAGQAAPRRVVFANVTDAAVARRRGFRSLSLMTLKDGWIENLHRPTDVPENVDWQMVGRSVELVEAVAAEWGG
jgi:hypothetical protein